MKSNIFIPKTINVGYQNRSGTYTGKLAYVIYYDEKGKLRKEASWNSWRDEKIPNEEFDNVPTSGFVLNKKVGDYSSGWDHRQAYCRVYDPRNFEFEITVENLLYILENVNSIKGKGLEGEFVYGWDGKDLVLMPVESPDYKQIIDDNKAFWMLKKPGSQYRKVCLYRDSCNMFVYGDYGQFTFDSMTWTGSVYNLEYDNIGYQMEKLNYESRESLRVFDDTKCEEDIFDWLKEQLESYYSLDDDELEKVAEFFNPKTWNSVDEVDIEEFCDKNDLSEIESIIEFTRECCMNIDEYEWIPFLRSNYNRLYDFGDEPCESWLWNAGKCIHQRYFICMYALQVCGEKLSKQKENT